MSWKFEQVEAGGRTGEVALHHVNIQVSGQHIPPYPELQEFPKDARRRYRNREESQHLFYCRK